MNARFSGPAGNVATRTTSASTSISKLSCTALPGHVYPLHAITAIVRATHHFNSRFVCSIVAAIIAEYLPSVHSTVRMTTTSGATTFCHIVDKDTYDLIPEAGTPLYLAFDLIAGQRIGGRPVGQMHTTSGAGRKFGGIITYDQPDQHDIEAVTHPTPGRSFYMLQTTIHGVVQAVIDDGAAPDPHTLQMQRFDKPPVPELYVDPLHTLRKVPNGTLFVMLCL